MLCSCMYIYALWCCYTISYDYKSKIKRNLFRKLMFSNSFKIKFMHVHPFITKLEVAGTMTMTHELFSRNPTKKSCISHSCVFASSSEDGVRHMIIYVKFPIWHWHFNPMLNASVLTARSARRSMCFMAINSIRQLWVHSSAHTSHMRTLPWMMWNLLFIP